MSPGTQSPLSPDEPTRLPGYCVSSHISSEFFLVVHPSPCLLSRELHSRVLLLDTTFGWLLSLLSCPSLTLKLQRLSCPIPSCPILSHPVWLLLLPSPLQTSLCCCSSCWGFNHTGSIPYLLWSIVVFLWLCLEGRKVETWAALEGGNGAVSWSIAKLFPGLTP